MDKQEIAIPLIMLEWSDWHPWPDLLRDGRTDEQAVRLPSGPGVYEARLVGEETRLTIGKASSLRMRVTQGLVRGSIPHSAGIAIRSGVDVSQVLVRWAETDRPAAAEEELHRLYRLAYGDLPRFTKRT